MKTIRTSALLVVPVLWSFLAFSQTRPEFEVASIRPVSQIANNAVAAGLRVDGSQVRYSDLTLKDYIGLAYRIRGNQVAGPDWLSSVTFDIAAKLPDGGKTEQVPEMLQNLLTDRFQMQVHRDKKEFPVYALIVDKGGLKIPELPADPDFLGVGGGANVDAAGNGTGVAINFGKGSTFSLGTTQLEIKKLPMGVIADMLTRFLDRPVIDMTELKGAFDITLDLSPEDRTAMLIRSAIAAGVTLPAQAMRVLDISSGDSLFNALQKAGLKLDARKAPLDVVVVDNMRKTPTEN
jgi:uncharacterized protein (TIGR03435 family)